MSGHSVTVKRADEVVVGDWINRNGVAHEVTMVTGTRVVAYVVIRGGYILALGPAELVEVMDK